MDTLSVGEQGRWEGVGSRDPNILHGACGFRGEILNKHASIIRSPREGLMGGLQASYDAPEVDVDPLSPGANRVAILKTMVYNSHPPFQ